MDRLEALQNTGSSNSVQRNHVCCMELWVEALGNPRTSYNKMVARELNQIMVRIQGWRRGKNNYDFGVGYNKQKHYERI